MKKIKYLLIAICIMFLGIINVSAEETDFSNATLTVEGLTEESHQISYIKISDVVFETNTAYYALLTKDNLDILDSFEVFNEPDNLEIIQNNVINKYSSMAEKYGDIYVTIYEYQSPNYVKVTEPILLKRPEELKLSKRISAYLWDDSSDFFLNSLNDINTVRKVNYKLGKINDITILKNIKNGNYFGLESLLNYAKNNSDVITSGQVELKSDLPPIYEQKDVSKNNYYYLYLEVDTENGKYYPIEDISLYQALETNGKLDLISFTDKKFEWNIEEDNGLTEWEKFVESFKNNKYTTEYKSTVEGAGGTFTIQHDDSTLKLILNDSTGSFTTIFNHNNGIVSYASKDGIGASQLMFDNIWISVAIDTLCNKFGYNTDKVLDYLDSRTDFSLDKDGIEFTIDTASDSTSSGGVTGSISTEGFKNIKFDIIKGLKNYTGSSTGATLPENPKTGLSYPILGILIVLSVSIGTVFYLKKKKLLKSI